MQPGTVLPVIAKHDTYSIAFDYRPEIDSDNPHDAFIASAVQGAEINVGTGRRYPSGAIQFEEHSAVAETESDVGVSVSPGAGLSNADTRSLSRRIEIRPRPVPTDIPLKVRVCGVL